MAAKLNSPDIQTYTIIFSAGLKISHSISDGQGGFFILNRVFFPIVLIIHIAR